ncbi:hypothetical protein HYS48_02625, partial [Candidatus Woesearchaeota archaeon]|nr:hypothetical protein [Candidatus Woesearchaeota archaeon]
AQATLTIPSGDWQYGENAIIAYSCKQIGGSLDCGKQNQNDNQRRWRRHLFTVSQGGQQPKGNEAAMRIKEEADWIISCCKRATGALRLASNGNINPYFSNFAAEGLLVGGSDYSVDVKGWMQWYLAHLNRPDHLGVYGTVYDYSVTPAGVEQSTGNYDSSDSYAATFLSLVRKYYDATGDLQFIQDNLADLKVVAGAIDATLQPDGLTWAKKDYQIKYLMDNVEVWQGYSDFAYLLTLVDDPAAAQYSAKANQVRNGIEANLWDTVNQQYYPHFGGAMNWNTFYPNATANMWPLIFNLPEAEARTNALWQKFITNHPTWKTNQADAFPWTAHALAAIEAGDTTTAREFDENTRAKFLPARQWTWNTNEAGWYIRYTKRLY